MPLTDVQWVLGHVHLSITQIYVAPADDVVQSVLAHHRRQQDGQVAPPPARLSATGRRRWTSCSAGSHDGRPGTAPGERVRARSGRGCVPERMPRGWNGSRSGPSRTVGDYRPGPGHGDVEAAEGAVHGRDDLVQRGPPRRGLARFLDWLSQYPGDTWQQRWLASGVAGDGGLDWRPQAAGG